MDVKQERKRNIIIGLVLAVGSFAIIQGLIIILVIARTTFSESVSKLFKRRKEKADVK